MIAMLLVLLVVVVAIGMAPRSSWKRILSEEERAGATEDPGDPYRPTELDLRRKLTMYGAGRWPWRLVAVAIRPRTR